MAEEDGFVRRWARRKREARARARAADPVSTTTETPPPSPTVTEAPGLDAADTIDIAALPDIESLTYESDFTLFLRSGVPAELRRRALQRLWRSDPLLANLDGLVEYGADYSQVGTTEQIVSTAYRVGRGMLDRLEASAERPPAERSGGASPSEPAPRGGGEPGETEPPALGADPSRGADAEETADAAADSSDDETVHSLLDSR
jgi:hypothetical protein